MVFTQRPSSTNENQIFEKNDSFFFIFAVPGITTIILGLPNFSWEFWVGIGITLYGFAYFIIHDLFIHQRSKIFRNTKSKYLNGLRRATRFIIKTLVKKW